MPRKGSSRGCTRSTEQANAAAEQNNDENVSERVTTQRTEVTRNSDKPKLQSFKGKDDFISIDDWLNLYIDKTDFLQWNDRMKLSFLDEYLENEALAWFAQNRSGNTWTTIVSLLKKRFGKPLARPIMDLIHLKYDKAKGFAEYFREKQYLASKAHLSDAVNHIIPIMIDGLPADMQSYFVAYDPSDLNEFYLAGLRAENANMQNNKRKLPESTSDSKQPNKKFKKTVKKKPPSPCYICTKLGHENKYHWASDCRYKALVAKKSNDDDQKDKDKEKSKPSKKHLN